MSSTSNVWIRSWRWDSWWILCGGPLALAFLALNQYAPALPLGAGLTTQEVIRRTTVVLLAWANTAHLLSPIALAWLHPGHRQVAMRRPHQYITIPVAFMGFCLLMGLVSYYEWPAYHPNFITAVGISDFLLGDFRNPFVLTAAAFVLWNGYHFGQQNFGIIELYRNYAGFDRAQRQYDWWFACLTTWTAMVIPFVRAYVPASAQYLVMIAAVIPTIAMLSREFGRSTLPRTIFIVTLGAAPVVSWWTGPWFFAIIAYAHWSASIGVDTHIYAEEKRWSAWMVAVPLCIVGTVVFFVLFPPSPTLVLSIMVIPLSLRLGIAFVHFWYEYRIKKFRRPEVRNTFGANLRLVNQQAA